MADSSKFFGMTDYSWTAINNISSMTVRNSLFENCRSTNGLSVNLPEDSTANIILEDCSFIHFTPDDDPAVSAVIPEGSSLTLRRCHFTGRHDVPASLWTVRCPGCVWRMLHSRASERYVRASRPAVRLSIQQEFTHWRILIPPLNKRVMMPWSGSTVGGRCFMGISIATAIPGYQRRKDTYRAICAGYAQVTDGLCSYCGSSADAPFLFALLG